MLAQNGLDTAPPTQRSERSTIAYLAFLGVMLATGIDIALPAFGSIERELPGASNTSLLITAYLIGMAIGQLVVGPVSDRYGRQVTVIVGLGLYLVAAIAAALSPSFAVLLIARVVWGLGASAPAGLRAAIARDLYTGDDMARITTIVMAVFLLGPVFIPLVGEGLLQFGSWRLVFWAPAILSLVGIGWCWRFGETLDPAQRRPLRLGPVAQAGRTVIRTRVTIGFLMANMFLSGAFFIFLGSTQPVFERVYDRANQFAWLFALTGLVTIPLLLIANRLIDKVGAVRVATVGASISCAFAVVFIAPTIGADGIPTFWLWYSWLVVVTSSNTIAAPSLYALALEPMGELAGTASSVFSFASFAGGAGLAAIFDIRVDTTVSPFVIGYALYTTVGLAAVLWAARDNGVAAHPS